MKTPTQQSLFVRCLTKEVQAILYSKSTLIDVPDWGCGLVRLILWHQASRAGQEESSPSGIAPATCSCSESSV
eukprot:4606886-Amphidinium_carterae.1